MNKAKYLQLSIPAPCSENWEQMTPDAQGRFCAHCQKSVIDFTGWTDAMLFDFFNRQKNETVCGRLLNTQLNRAIRLPPQPHSLFYRVAVALGLTILITQAQHIQARPLPPLTGQNLLTAGYPQNDSTATTDSITIKGQVLDERNEPLIGGYVFLKKGKTIIGSTMSDIDGNFKIVINPNIDDPNSHSAIIGVKCPGYETISKTVSLNHPIINLSLQMAAPVFLGGSIVIQLSEHRPPLNDRANPGTKTFTRKDIHNMGY